LALSRKKKICLNLAIWLQEPQPVSGTISDYARTVLKTDEISMTTERRGAPRYEARVAEFVMLPFPVNVQVIDISVAGVLLQSSRPIDVGTRGSLRLNIDGTPFQAEVDVRRVAPGPTGKDLTYRIGAQFVSISPEHRQIIERFTSH